MERIFSPKFFSIIGGKYTRKEFSTDALAGIVVGIVALPLAIAFAVASGVSPEKGLVTAIVAGFLVSLLHFLHNLQDAFFFTALQRPVKRPGQAVPVDNMVQP